MQRRRPTSSKTSPSTTFTQNSKNCNDTSSSSPCKKNTSKMNKRTSNASSSAHRRKSNAFNQYPSLSANSWNPLTNIPELSVQPLDLIMSYASSPPLIASSSNPAHQSRSTVTPTHWSTYCRPKQTAVSQC